MAVAAMFFTVVPFGCGSDPAAVDAGAGGNTATSVVGTVSPMTGGTPGSLPDSTTDEQDEMAMRVLRADPQLGAKLADGSASVTSIRGWSSIDGRPFGVVAVVSFTAPTVLTGSYYTSAPVRENATSSGWTSEDGKPSRVPLPETYKQNVWSMNVGIEAETESVYLVWTG